MWSKKKIDVAFAAFRFGAIGLAATGVHLVVAAAAISAGVNAIAANSLGFISALTISLIGHHIFSFKGRTSFWYGARRFAPVALVGFLINNLALASLVATTGDDYALVKIAIATLVIPPGIFCLCVLFCL